MKESNTDEKVRLTKVAFMCKSCKRLYPTPNKLRQHLRNIVVKITYFCSPCNAFFGKDHPCNLSGKRCAHCKQLLTANTNFRNHLCFHEHADKIFCKYCQTEITGTPESDHFCRRKSIIEEHIEKKTLEPVEGDMYLCKPCGDRITLSNIFTHLYPCIRRNYKKVSYIRRGLMKCHVCDRSFKSEQELTIHHETITPKLIHFCHRCVKFFFERDDHGKCVPCDNETQIIPFCIVCKRGINQVEPREHICFHTFTETDIEMADHARTILSDYENFLHLCEFCGQDIPSRLRSDHYNYLHPNMPLPTQTYRTCNICMISFIAVKNYTKHNRRCHNSYLCHICGKGIKGEKVKAHRDAHFNIKRYKCKECDKAFSMNVGLKRHMLVHSGEAKHKCETCGKSFKSRFNLRVHMRIHADVKPFECVICKKTFTTKQWRDNHLRTHKVMDS